MTSKRYPLPWRQTDSECPFDKPGHRIGDGKLDALTGAHRANPSYGGRQASGYDHRAAPRRPPLILTPRRVRSRGLRPAPEMLRSRGSEVLPAVAHMANSAATVLAGRSRRRRPISRGIQGIIANPPFRLAARFAKKAVGEVDYGLEGKTADFGPAGYETLSLRGRASIPRQRRSPLDDPYKIVTAFLDQLRETKGAIINIGSI